MKNCKKKKIGISIQSTAWCEGLTPLFLSFMMLHSARMAQAEASHVNQKLFLFLLLLLLHAGGCDACPLGMTCGRM